MSQLHKPWLSVSPSLDSIDNGRRASQIPRVNGDAEGSTGNDHSMGS